jgi:thiol-disulfide isomerase/thioredoxin
MIRHLPPGSRAFTLAGVLACATLAIAMPSSAGRGVPSGPSRAQVRDALASCSLRSIDGRALSFASLKGQVLVVNFWASWCRPCRRELPMLESLNRDLASRGGRVIAISIDEDPENVRRFARANHLRLPLYLDGPSGLARRLDLAHIPFTVVIDRGGDVVFTTSGAGEDGLVALGAASRRALDTQASLPEPVQGETR